MVERVISQGCTQYLKDLVADIGQQWIRGKVFGFSFLGTNRDFLPLWSPGVWNSVCIAASTEAGGPYTVNINGQIVLRTKNREAIFNTQKAGFDVFFSKYNNFCSEHCPDELSLA